MTTSLIKWIGRPRDRGATAVEYALLASLIAAVILAVVMVIGQKTSSNFELFNSALP